jgi:ribonuclease HI
VPEASNALTTIVYTDGACSGNPGPGGWAWAVADGRFESGAESHTTNQRMEIKAALEAVRGLPGRLEVVSDSAYVVNCFKQRWHVTWRANGWRNSQKKPVANRDLWEPFIELALARHVTFRWVKGHGTDPMNAWVDELAVLAAQSGQGQKGQRGRAIGPE